jgi:hypothetical protein
LGGHLFNFIRNQVDWIHSNESDQFTLTSLDPSRVRKASFGVGTLYFYNIVLRYGVRLGSELFLSQETPIAPSSQGSQNTAISHNKTVRFPCSGIITGSEEGYLIAPTIRMDIAEGQDIALMLLSPRTSNHTLSSEKPTLTIPDDEASVIVSEEAGELRCTGSVAGSKFQAGRLVLNRNPHLPVYEDGYNEVLCKLAGPGEINATWKPVSRTFEECLFRLPSWSTRCN